jgi:ATP-dependent Clp protease protease subunit
MLKPPHSHGSRQWFRVKSKSGKNAEVLIYDEIGAGFFGGGVAAEDLINELRGLKLVAGDELTVRINSPGGSMFEGNSIYNYLRTVAAKVVVRIDGVAASAASIIAMAGDRIEMPANAMLFIHNPWMFVAGDAKRMRKTADDLDQMRDGAVATYMRRAGDKLDQAKLVEMLDAETWLSAEDSVKYGLADVVDEPVRALNLAKFDFSKYGFPVPKALRSTDRMREQLRQLAA